MPTRTLCQTEKCRRNATDVIYAEANPYSGVIKVCKDSSHRRIARRAFPGKTESMALPAFLDEHFPRVERTTEQDRIFALCFDTKMYGTDQQMIDVAQQIALKVLVSIEVDNCQIIDAQGNIIDVDLTEARRLARGA